ncbi:MAG: thermonuclease family protein, partial [Gammaproteobacteria bacterium]|nr:thermonuclease family protein [Gammaproteobacteria bacterium]
ADVLYGRVVDVIDGDTLDLLVGRTQHRIRLAQIDTPEKGQAWGSQATWALEAQVLGQYVSVQVLERDRYGRLVGNVWLGRLDINRQLVAQGHAWAYRRYLTDETFLQVEAAARQQTTGLWSISGPVAPWLWRRGTRAPTVIFASGRLADKNYCGEMSSCEEAYQYFSQRGLSHLDGDRDGVPCEALCR